MIRFYLELTHIFMGKNNKKQKYDWFTAYYIVGLTKVPAGSPSGRRVTEISLEASHSNEKVAQVWSTRIT